MLLDVFIAMFGKDYGAILEVERRVLPLYILSPYSFSFPLSAGVTVKLESVLV